MTQSVREQNPIYQGCRNLRSGIACRTCCNPGWQADCKRTL